MTDRYFSFSAASVMFYPLFIIRNHTPKPKSSDHHVAHQQLQSANMLIIQFHFINSL
jgi:hypothetical protein